MAGGKKVKKKSGKYADSDAHSSSSPYCSDKRLIPRMKEYLRKAGESHDLDQMVASLQSSYPEYSRRKKQVFQNLVGRLYLSLQSSGWGRGEWLEQREKQHFEKRMRQAEEEEGEGVDLERFPITSALGSDEEEEEEEEEEELMSFILDPEVDSFNSVNDQLLQLYKSSGDGATATSDPCTSTSESPPTECQHGACSTQSSPAVAAVAAAAPAVVDVVVVPATTAVSHVAANDEGGGQTQATNRLNWHSLSTSTTPALNATPPPDITTTATSVETTATSMSGPLLIDTPSSLETTPTSPSITTPTADPKTTPTAATPTPSRSSSTPSGLHSILKKVTFSTPEVTEQHQVAVSASSRTHAHRDPRKLKRRHHHHGTEEGEAALGAAAATTAVKRRKTKESGGGEGSSPNKRPESRTREFRVQSSEVKFCDVGGCESTIEEICKLLLHLRHPEVFSRLGVRPPQGFLLHGPPGCGKTLLAHAIAGELNLPFIKVAATEVVSGVSGESEGTLRDLFSLAKSHTPCVLFLDEIDAICRKRETAQREMERRIVTQLLACMDDLSQSRVLVIGATSSPDSLDPALRRAGRFDREVSLGIPDQQARESILKVLVRALRLEPEFSFLSISRETPGFVGADLMALVREASLCAVNRVLSESASSKTAGSDAGGGAGEVGGASGGSGSAVTATGLLERYSTLSEEELSRIFVTAQDFSEALRMVQPSAKREGFATVPDVTWDDVGALEAIREELSYAILAPVRYPDHFASLGLTRPPGVLLSGPPGCGKTLLAKAIANESGINFISVKGPELLNMYVGESERAVRQVFQRARNSAPCVIFFDELDALCPKRSDVAESSASSRVVNQLLTEMDGLVSRRQVFVMGATNRPDIIDPAVLRPGRLDKILYVGLPNPEDRLAILNTITKHGSKPKLDGGVDLQLLASDQYSKGYSGADLTALVREAAIAALREHMQVGAWSSSQPPPPPPPLPLPLAEKSGGMVVGMRHFLAAVAKIKPSVSEKDIVRYEQMSFRL